MSLVYPFNDLRAIEENAPTIMTEGKGAYVTDTNGKTYLDAVSGLWCASLGFDNEALIRAGEQQLRKLPYYHSFLGRGVDVTEELAQQLTALAPDPLSHVFFGCSGSEAVDTAVKFVWYYNNAKGRPRKKRIIAREGAYHGSGIMSATLTAMAYCHDGFDLPHAMVLRTRCPSFFDEAAPGESEIEFSKRLARELDALITREGADTIGAFIGEPVIGSGGIYPPPEGYWAEIKAVLAKHDILLIADEIITGFGRTGRRFASDLYDLEPDMMTVAKQLSGAYFPISGTLVSAEIHDTIADYSRELGVLGHGFTYGGHPVGAAIALEALRQYDELDTETRVAALSEQLAAGLAGLRRQSNRVADVRQVGLMVGMQLLAGDGEGPSPAAQVARHCEENGVLFRVINNTIAISPPLISGPEEIDAILNALSAALVELETGAIAEMV
jgi:4-aminobutyrate--pyruvate transaminase